MEFVYHPTLGLRVTKKEKEEEKEEKEEEEESGGGEGGGRGERESVCVVVVSGGKGGGGERERCVERHLSPDGMLPPGLTFDDDDRRETEGCSREGAYL